jgi:serine protease Do
MHDMRKIGKWLFISIFFIGLGIVAGITITSNFNMIPPGKAVSTDSKAGPPLPSSSGRPDETFVEISKSDTPAVVNISTTRLIKNETGPNPFFEDPFFRRFFGEEFGRQFEQPKERKEQSLGSGVIVESNGIIVTNNHVVANADEIKVFLSDKREFKGKVVGTDPKTDLAVIRISASDLPTIPWGDSAKMQVGEYVLAIGNPFGLNQTVTMGIVSALGRANVGISDYEDFIQTDAAINPGNSGGALVNTKGELIGINTAIFSRSGGYMGIGFAIPSNMAKAVLESIKKEGKVVRGWLGVSIQDISPTLAKQFGIKENAGALVSDVMENSPADKGGIKRGDVIFQYQGKAVDNPGHLRNAVAETPVGTKVKLTIIRDRKEMTVQLTIGEQPKNLTKAGAEGEEKSSEESRAVSGLDVSNLTKEMARRLGVPYKENMVVVTNVDPGSPAEEAGVLRGDIILEINRTMIKNADDYDRVMGQVKKGSELLLLINRQGRTLFLTFSP